MRPRNVILTGPPRAGKTLTATLLNRLPDTVALNEPMGKKHFKDRGTVLKEVEGMFRVMRRSLLKDGVAAARGVDPSADLLEKMEDTNRFRVRFKKALSRDFLLAIEHAMGFTAVLPELNGRYPCFAVVRNPLALLACWSRHDGGVRKGRLRVGERLDDALRAETSALPAVLDRRIHFLRWFFKKYHELPPERILRYEDIVASGGKALKVITPAALRLEESLVSENALALEGWKGAGEAGRRLLAADGAFWRFYTRKSVETLMEPVS